MTDMNACAQIPQLTQEIIPLQKGQFFMAFLFLDEYHYFKRGKPQCFAAGIFFFVILPYPPAGNELAEWCAFY